MKRKFRRRISGLFLAAILLLGLLSGLRLVGYRNTRRLVDSDRQIAFSQSIVNGLGDVYSAIQQAEGAARDYLLSGEARFLESYHVSASAIPQRIGALNHLLVADRDRSQQLGRMIPLLDAELRELDGAVRSRSARAADDDPRILSAAHDERTMGAIGDEIRVMQAQEIALINRHAIAAASGSRRSMIWFLTLSAIDVVLLSSGLALLNRHMSRREQAEDCALRLNADLQQKNQELESAQRRMQLARDAAEAANRAKDQFLAMVTHDLRSPLSGILLWTGMARRHATSQGPELSEALDGIEASAKTQSRLVEDLLDVARIVHGKLRIEAEHINLPDVIRASVTAHAISARSKGIELIADLDGCDVPVWGDPHRIGQAVGNLLSNAIKFTPEGGRVRVSLGHTPADVFIGVEDNGRGISPEFLPRVFDRFSQDDPAVARESTGLGLGLAIVEHIARLHGGSIQASSGGAGRGSTFTLTLPLSARSPARTSSTNGRQSKTTSPKAISPAYF